MRKSTTAAICDSNSRRKHPAKIDASLLIKTKPTGASSEKPLQDGSCQSCEKPYYKKILAIKSGSIFVKGNAVTIKKGDRLCLSCASRLEAR